MPGISRCRRFFREQRQFWWRKTTWARPLTGRFPARADTIGERVKWRQGPHEVSPHECSHHGFRSVLGRDGVPRMGWSRVVGQDHEVARHWERRFQWRGFGGQWGSRREPTFERDSSRFARFWKHVFRLSTSQTAGDRLENLGQKVPDWNCGWWTKRHANQKLAQDCVWGELPIIWRPDIAGKGDNSAGSGQVSLNLLYWKKNVQTEICGLDQRENDRHTGQINCGQKSEKQWERMPSWRSSKSGRMKSSIWRSTKIVRDLFHWPEGYGIQRDHQECP